MIYQRNLFDFVDIERREPLHSFSPPTVVYESLAETEYYKTKMPRYCGRPLPLFSDSGPTDGLSISIQITDLSASSLIVHTELIDQATLGSAYKEVLDEYYSK